MRESDMNIQILCPKCDGMLSDTFSAPSCKLSTCDKALNYILTMECTKCELDVGVYLKLETDYKQSGGE